MIYHLYAQLVIGRDVVSVDTLRVESAIGTLKRKTNTIWHDGEVYVNQYS